MVGKWKGKRESQLERGKENDARTKEKGNHCGSHRDVAAADDGDCATGGTGGESLLVCSLGPDPLGLLLSLEASVINEALCLSGIASGVTACCEWLG
jgi:hypothetical protein